MISILDVRRWAVASQEQALANARAAAVECSRARLERGEVDAYLADLAALRASWTGGRVVAQAR